MVGEKRFGLEGKKLNVEKEADLFSGRCVCHSSHEKSPYRASVEGWKG